MKNRKAFLRPKSAQLSLLPPAKKSTTRGPSPRRTPETEAAGRLAKFGWSIISNYSSLDQPCVMIHSCGFKLSGLTPKSLCYSKKRFCAVCDRSPPSSWVNSTEELAQYIALVTQCQLSLKTDPAFASKIDPRCY